MSSVWLSVDPLAHLCPTQTPYHYCSNNPVNRIDPDGRNDDEVILNSTGTVVKVIPNDQPNRFFDQDGNELFLNDAEEVDAHLLEDKFIVGDQLFTSVSTKEYAGALKEAGIEDDRGPLSTAIKSHGSADFAEGFLAENFSLAQGSQTDSRRANYSSQSAYFKFEGSDKLYNLYDAGNHMWGSWMRLNGWSESDALRGANWNELGGDSNADQRAISNGWRYGTYNPYR